jgi:hypothetical protein
LPLLASGTRHVLKADYTKGLASGFDSLRSKIQSLQIEGAAIGGTTEQLRQAAVAAQLAEYTAAHPGLDTGSAEWKNYADEVERASKAQQDNADASAALKYNLSNSFGQAIADLQKYRQQLEYPQTQNVLDGPSSAVSSVGAAAYCKFIFLPACRLPSTTTTRHTDTHRAASFFIGLSPWIGLTE